MPLHQGSQQRRNERRGNHLRQGPGYQQRDHLRTKSCVLRGFNHHGELHGWFLHLHSGLRVCVKRPVNNVGPLNQLRNRRRIKTKMLFADHRNKAGARFEAGIVKLVVALLLLEVRGIGRA